jgi:hypothetical protein
MARKTMDKSLKMICPILYINYQILPITPGVVILTLLTMCAII